MSVDLIPAWLDAAAVLVGAFSGALAARERHLDIVGYIALSIICGLGGGLVRDTIMQCGDVYMLSSPYAIPMAVMASVIVLLTPETLDRHPDALEWVDIISVALFVMAGTDKAIRYELNPWAVVLMGTVTGVGGGMMRDVFMGETPKIFQRSNLYALCAVAGAVVYQLLESVLVTGRPVAALACILLVVGLRRISLRFNVLSPSDEELAPMVKDRARNLVDMAQERGRSESESLNGILGTKGERKRGGRGKQV